MARIRTVKPEFWEDDTIGELPRDARLLFLATFNMADDEGLLRWSPAYIKAQAFMYDDDLSVADIEKLMRALTDSGLVVPYSSGGKARQQLAWIVNFHRHQRVNRPQASKLNPPTLTNIDVMAAYKRRDKYICHLCGGDLPARDYRKVDPYGPEHDSTCLNFSLDHVTPRSEGGTDHPGNIRSAHIGCNKGRGNRPTESFTTPPSVQAALSRIASVSEATKDSVTDSVSSSVSDSLNEDDHSVAVDVALYSESEIRSLNGSVSDPWSGSLLEGKGTGKGKEATPTELAVVPPAAPAPIDDDHPAGDATVTQRTQAIAKVYYDLHGPMTNWNSVQSLAKAAIAAGWADEAIKNALRRLHSRKQVPTKGHLERELQGPSRQPSRPSATERAARTMNAG